MMIARAHRAEVLAAVALVARSRKPMAEGLAELADGDPLLTRWARRLSEPLRRGTPLPEVLHQHGFISSLDAALLERDADLAPALDRLVNAVVHPPRGLLMVTWLPTAFAIAMAVPATALVMVLELFDIRFAIIYRDLGILLPVITGWLITPGMLILYLSAMVATSLIVQLLLRRTWGLRHLLHLWCPEVHRQSALVRLINYARCDDQTPLRPGRWTWISWVLWSARVDGRPAWDLDYRTWMFLSRFRLRRSTRRQAALLPDLPSRLIVLGIVTVDNGTPDWTTAEQICRQRLERALGGALLIITPPLLLTVWITGLMVLISLPMPLFKILEELGKQT